MFTRLALVATLACATAFAQGAVPIPDESAVPESLNLRDTSVKLADLPPHNAKWKVRSKVRYRGVVPVALNAGANVLKLSFVGPVNPESGYPGSLEDVFLLPEMEQPPGGNSFPALNPDDKTGRSHGPIHAAIRALPREGAPESERRQVVVYNPPGRTNIILVATKLATADRWLPLARIDLPNAKRIALLDPGWH